MTFLYCNDRWRDNLKRHGPGPGEYDVASKVVTEPEEGTQCQGKLYRKKNYDRKGVERPEDEFREMINRQMGVGDCEGSRRQTKRGKICKNLSMAQKLTSKQNSNPDHNLLIKSDGQGEANPHSRNKWGNMRIKEMLNQRNEQTKIPPKKYSCGRQYSQTALVEDRTRFKQDLRELQNIFNSNRKGSNQKLTIKLFHQNREIKINKGFALKNTDNGVRMSLSPNQEFQVEPAAVYKIERMEVFTPQISRPETPKYSSSNSSVKGGREETMQTGLEQNSLEDSMQYIEDATPGPGSYNLDREVSEKRPVSRIGKFGVTMQRFKTPKRYNTAQTFINPNYPNFKKESKATQEKVGFGRSTRQEADRTDHMDIFYEDVNNLQHKSTKWLEKQRKENIGFESCKERFNHEPREREETSQLRKDEQKEEILEQCKPNSIFISKVTRELYINSNTEEVDFHGQNYNCLANKLKKDKEHLEDFELHPPPFMTNSTRFKYHQEKPQEKVDQLKLVKIQELKQRKEAKKKKIQKGYTFLKEERKDGMVCQSQSPSPDKYDSSPRWIKDSYNIRFHC